MLYFTEYWSTAINNCIALIHLKIFACIWRLNDVNLTPMKGHAFEFDTTPYRSIETTERRMYVWNSGTYKQPEQSA